jgi:ATP-binding cassette, subfamily B, multidrug efflux pump
VSAIAPRRKVSASTRKQRRDFREEDPVLPSHDWGIARRLASLIKPHAKYAVISLLSLMVMAGANLVRPIIMGDIVREAVASRADALLRDGCLLGGLLVVLQGIAFAQTYTMQIAGARAMSDMRASVFTVLQTLELRYFDRTPVGRLVTQATSDVDAVGELFSSDVLSAAGDLLGVAGIIVMMLVLDWRLASITFAALPIVGLLVAYIRERARNAFRAIRVETARLNAFLNEQVNGIAVVQAYARENAMAVEFGKINRAYRDASRRAIYYESLLDAAVEMVGTLCIASVLSWSGFHSVGSHAVTFATLVTFTQYIKQLFEPIGTLSTRYAVLQSALAGAERVFQLLDVQECEPPSLPTIHCTPDGPPDEAILLENVWLEYKAELPVLKDVSLVAKRGERLALVGATGAGKTSVSNVLLRLYEPSRGTVRVLGKDIRSYDRHELRECFSVVPQDVFLFRGTLLSNIAIGDPRPDRNKALRALERVGAIEVLMNREDGLDAIVDERGGNFSAGERQLIAFARAIYRDAPILLLDEATASVDPDTEKRLQIALETVLKGRTALIIAHRLSTIRAVDRILVFHHGRIVEIGTHDQLIAQDGVYACLYRLQSTQRHGGMY